MATITLENVPESIVKQYGSTMPFSYDLSFSREKPQEDITLLEYIHSDEYKNDRGEVYDSAKAFLRELKKYKNKQ